MLCSSDSSTPGGRAINAQRCDFPNLDLLRSIAVLCVLGEHIAWLLLGADMRICDTIGRFGVLIFFVHTALVLMLSLERMADQPGWPWRFYLQRIFRIYPLSALCVILVLAGHVPRVPMLSFRMPPVSHIAANLLLVQNFLPGDLQSLCVSAPLWSLPFEVQMYAVLPLIFHAARRTSDAVAGLIPFSMALAIAEVVVHPNPWLTEFVPCFMGGVLAYSRAKRVAARLPSWAWPICIVLLGCIYCGLGMAVQWPVCLLLGWVIPSFQERQPGFISTTAKMIARYSYGIYLAHVPLIWLCFVRLEGLPVGVRWLLLVVLLCSVPPLLYHTIEHPLIRAGKRITRTTRTLAGHLATAPR